MRARRRQALARLRSRAVRKPGDFDLILPFDEVVAALGRVGERDLGVAGHRCSARSSAPSTARRASTARSGRRHRGSASAGSASPAAMRPGERCRRSTPTGSATYTSSATATTACPWRARFGHREIEALRDRDDHPRRRVARAAMHDLPLKSHERLFCDRVPLPPEDAARIQLSDPRDYGRPGRGRGGLGVSGVQERARAPTASGRARVVPHGVRAAWSRPSRGRARSGRGGPTPTRTCTSPPSATCSCARRWDDG